MKKADSVRKVPALIMAAGLLVSLAACSPPVSNLARCEAPYATGDNSDAVKVTGKVGSEPSVSFPTPLIAKSAEVSTVEPGEGAPIYPGQTIEYLATQYDPKTGEATASTGYDAGSAVRSVVAIGNDLLVPFLACTSVGSRIVVTTDAKSAYGESYDPETMDGDETLVLVFDITAAYLGKANGWDQLPQAGFPSVVLAPDGRPGITVPGSDAPTNLKIATLKAGTGATVEEDSNVVLQYTGVGWQTGTVFDSSWESQTGAPVTFAPSQVVAGFAKAIVGSKVGSQVIVVIPPGEEFGYPADSSPVGPDNTMIFVIDILGIEP